MTSKPGLAQSVSETTGAFADAQLVFEASVVRNACTLSLKTRGHNNPYVLNLPTILSTNLQNLNAGPMSQFVLRFDISNVNGFCLVNANNSPFKLLFDPSAFDALQGRNGILSNAARNNPATNVMVQIGHLGENGQYTPINLAEPQWVRFMTQTKTGFKPVAELSLAIRYVSLETVIALTGMPVSERDRDIKPGNVAVRLPFLLNFN